MAAADEVESAVARKAAVVGPTDRGFGITIAVVFVLVGLFPVLHGRALRPWAFAVAVILAAAAMVRPAILAPANRWWLKFGVVLHRIVNPLILGLMFFLVITPIGLLMQRLGRTSIAAAVDPGATSYWVKREPPGPEPKTMSRQF